MYKETQASGELDRGHTASEDEPRTSDSKDPWIPLPYDFYAPTINIREMYIFVSIISIPSFPLPYPSSFSSSPNWPRPDPRRSQTGAVEELAGQQPWGWRWESPTPTAATGNQCRDIQEKKGFASLSTQRTKSGSPSLLHVTQECAGKALLFGKRDFGSLACAVFLAAFKQAGSKYLNCFFF